MSSEPEEEPVSVLQRFEKRLEGLVEGAFAKVFKGVVHPVEILNAMQREAEAHKAILVGGRRAGSAQPACRAILPAFGRVLPGRRRRMAIAATRC